jgi:hypothetical protein
MSYNIINYDSSNLEILYDIHTSNGVFRANGRDIVSDTSNYTLNTSNNISDRLNNSVFSQWTTNGTDINYIVGKVGIGTTNPIAGELHISETMGTTHGFNSGTIILDHENNGGASSIVFRSKFNRGSDYGYIQYQDTSAVGGSGESARLFIGTNNETDDHICLMPSGSVGIGTATPLRKLHIQGDINYTGGLYLNNVLQSFASETYAVTTSNLLSTRLNNVYTKAEDDVYNTNTSNLLSTRLNNVYTKTEDDSFNTNTSNILSTRLNNVYTKEEDNTLDSNNSNYILNSSNAISTRLSTLDSNNSNYILNSSNAISTRLSTLDSNNSNYILNSSNAISTRLSTLNSNNSNYILNSSNNISTRITSLNADSISDGSTNKFIVNGIYTGNVNIDGILTATDLIVPGTITTLNTQVYVTEQLQILNSSTGTAFNIIQNNSLGDVFNASNLTSQVFTIKNNGNIGIGTNSPLVKLHVQGNLVSSGKVGIGTTNPTAGLLHISESIGTEHGENAGSIILDHENNGGASSIVFRSRSNRGSDYGYIQYQDASTSGAGGESSRLFIGTNNEIDDHICLMPSGSVGIGTTTPLRKLQVQGDINYTGGLYLNNVLQSFASDTYAVTTSNVISTRITNLPQPNLTPYRLISDSYTIAQNNTQILNNSNYTTNTSNNLSNRLNNEVFSQWNTVGSHINYTAGNVGIGTATPQNRFTIKTNYSDENTGLMLDASDGDVYNIKFFSYVIGTGLVGHKFKLVNNSTIYDNVLCFGGNGNVGIGVSNPSYKLTVQGNTNLNGILYVAEPTGSVAGVNNGSILIDHENSGGASSITFRSKVNRGSDYGYIQYQDASSVGGAGESARLIIGVQNEGDDHICLLPSGNVGIGTNTPATKLHVAGDIAATGSISSFYSDERLKEDIKKIESPLNIIENLKGFYYKPNELAKSFGIKNDKREIGLSAQDVKRVLPEIVSLAPFDISRDSSNNIVSKSGEDYLTICYERMIPVIVEAIKELNNEIKELKRVNKELIENK